GRPLVNPKQDDREGRGRTDDLEQRIAAAIESADIAPPMGDFVRHATRTRVDDRFTSAEEFAAALRAAVRASTRDAHVPESTEPFRRSSEMAAIVGLALGEGTPAPERATALPLPAPPEAVAAAPALAIALAPTVVAPIPA